MNITFPLLNTDMSGGMRVTFQYMDGLIRRGHTVTMITPEDVDSGYFPYNPNCVRIAIRRPRMRRQWEYLPLVKELGNAIQDSDVIVANSWQAMYPASIGHFRYRSPVIFLIQHDHLLVESGINNVGLVRYLRSEIGIRLALQLPATKIAVSQWVADRIKGRHGHISKVIPNGVDISCFYPDSPLALERNKAFWILVLGRLAHWKGYMDALDAIRLARIVEPRIKMLLVTRESIPIPEDIPYKLIVPDNDDMLRACYCTADVFLYTSHYEGFGLPPLEAMACNTPVVTTSCGGIMDYVQDSYNCLVVPVHNSKELANGLLRVLNDVSLKAHLRNNGLETAKRFQLGMACERFCQFVENL